MTLIRLLCSFKPYLLILGYICIVIVKFKKQVKAFVVHYLTV